MLLGNAILTLMIGPAVPVLAPLPRHRGPAKCAGHEFPGSQRLSAKSQRGEDLGTATRIAARRVF